MVVGTFALLMPLTLARCMRITSRNGSRLMYQPGQAPPGMVWVVPEALPCASLRVRWTAEAAVATCVMPAPRFVSARFFLVGSVAGTSGGHCSAILELCRYASPHIMAVTQAA